MTAIYRRWVDYSWFISGNLCDLHTTVYVNTLYVADKRDHWQWIEVLLYYVCMVSHCDIVIQTFKIALS